MIYTLLNFLVWGLLLALIGGVIGWALRSLKARADTARGDRQNGGMVPGTSVDADEIDEMRSRLAEFDAVVAERDRLRMQVADMRHADSPGVVATSDAMDDLTAIDGIGPRIAELLAGIGVSTWADLAATDQATLQSMLDDAGSPFRTRDPSSWPHQAAVLASGRGGDDTVGGIRRGDR